MLNIVRFAGMTILLTILFSLLFCGCQLFTAPELLSTAERQMTEHPDSALETMRSIKKYAVLLPERRAKYGLLYSAALDKNRIDIASDSLIRFSTEYYDLHGTAEERMRSYYYLGRTQQHAGKNLAATLSYLDAEQYTDVVEDNYLKGLLYTYLAEVYVYHCRHLTAFEMAEKSYNYYKAAKIEKYQAYQLYEMGRICYYMRKYKQSLQYLLSAFEESKRIGFDGLHNAVICQLAIVYNAVKDYDNSYKYFVLSEKTAGDKAYNYADICGAAANTFAYKGFRNKAKTLLRRGWELAGDLGDSVAMRYYHSNYLSIIGKSKQSSKQHGYATQEHLHMLSLYVESPMKDAQSDYFEKKNRVKLSRARQEKVIIILLFVLLTIALCGTIYLIYRANKRQIVQKNIEIDNYIDTISQLKSSVNCSNNELAILLDEKLRDKFDIINQLCLTYYEYSESPKKQSVIFNKVRDIIDEIGCDKSIDDIVNRCRNNILVSLSEELPSLSNDEYRLASYMFAGFSTQTICVFFNCNKDALYNRKYRLKEKIKKNNPPKKEIYLQYLR